MNIEIADRLQKLRKENGYSQEQLAEALGISRQAVSKWERAESSPDTDNLICLAKLYKISLDELLHTDETVDEFKEDNILKEEIKDKSKPIILSIIDSVTPIFIAALYLVLGLVFDLWHPGWILFLFIPVIITFCEAIYKKDGEIFVYPVLVTIVYLFFSFMYNLWHILWILYLTVPIYYIIFGTIKNKNKK